jgi:hypothetical protein
MSINDKLSQVFDVESITVVDDRNTQIIEVNGDVIPKQDNAFEHDYNTTRNNLHTLLQQGQDALNAALEVAKQSEHPRAFEVVGNLMKHISDINHQLLDLHKKKQVFENPKGGEPKEVAAGVTNNSIFVGNTTELSKMLDDLRKGK